MAEEEMDMRYEAPRPIFFMRIGKKQLHVHLEKNSSVDALIKNMRGEMELDMHDFANFEKVGKLPFELPRNDKMISTKPGDLVLCQGNHLNFYYDENEWTFTPIGHVDGLSREELLDLMGRGDVKIKFFVEWTE